MLQSIEHAWGDNAQEKQGAWGQKIPEGGYDAVGNLLSLTTRDPVGEETVHFAYDALNQLVQEEGDGNVGGVESVGSVGNSVGRAKHDYIYDSICNRQVQDGVQGNFNSLNQLLDRGDWVYRYDKNGQTISIERGGEEETKQRTDYAYDGLGRLITLESGNQRTTYQYDAFHRRLSKTLWTKDNGDGENSGAGGEWCQVSSERFLYLDQNEVGSVDQEGKFLSFRALGRGVGAEIGASVAIEIAGRMYVPLHDQSGSIAALLDETGAVVEHARYSAFGEQTLFNAEGQSLGETAVGNPWGYANKRMDHESGWNFFGRRYYNPKEGRWMTPDPLGFADGPNLYAYVQNSPMTHFDLYGLAKNNPYSNPVNPSAF